MKSEPGAHGHGKGSAPKPARTRDEPEPAAPKARSRSLPAFLRKVDPFKVVVASALFLGLTLGLTAWIVQVRRATVADRHARLDQTLHALASTLRAHPEPPFRPTAAYLARLRDLTATRSALGHLDPGEGHPDADRQSFLEAELAEILADLESLRATVRDPRIVKDLRQAYERTHQDLTALQKATALKPEMWEAELAQACAAEGLPVAALQGGPARLGRVEAAIQDLEEALGLALFEARVLEAPDLEVVSFLPVPERTVLGAGGWQATGVGHDGRDPGRMITFTLEGTSLVHRLLNAGTWSSLARIAPGPQGGRRYAVDAACLRITERGSDHARRALEAAQALTREWQGANPLAAGLTFTRVPRKTFEDIYTDVEADAALGTPDGKPDLDHWPTGGELATVKEAFGPREDLVLLRHEVGQTPHLWVLAREGVTYTSGGDGPADRLAVLPGGLLLRAVDVEVPAVVGRQAFTVVRVVGRPRATKAPTTNTGAQGRP